jgi:hypothetical protein
MTVVVTNDVKLKSNSVPRKPFESAGSRGAECPLLGAARFPGLDPVNPRS